MWSDLVLGFGAGLAAAPHCLGMCGAFPLHIARTSGAGHGVRELVAFVVGKSFTYVFLGTLAAALGVVVLGNTRLAAAAPAMRVAAGVVTLVMGLLMIGVRLPVKGLGSATDAGFVRAVFSGMFARTGPLAAFGLGMAVGFLPCPLPLGMLALAAASHDLARGMALMAGVGLGTAPGLIAVGVFGVGLNRKLAGLGMKLAGVVVVVFALMLIGRATGLVGRNSATGRALPSCCQEHRP